MKKTIIISSILFSTLIADNSLGQPITISSAQESISTNSTPIKVTPTHHLTTRVTPKDIKSNFKKDHHRYDKRYSNFDYEENGYYNDDGYYYGYYDNSGYFYDNIYFTYDERYTYNDRYYQRGNFRYNHQHHRTYIHHHNNNWNQVHCYREPNHIVYGHYYDRSYYPTNRYRSNHYNHQRMPSRMSITRINHHREEHRYSNNHRSNNNRREYRQSREQPRYHRETTRMITRNSSSQQIHRSSTHMSMGK